MQFYMSFRIFVVILIQTFMNIFVFLIELIEDLPIIFSYFGYIYWLVTNLRPPSWITGYYGLSDEPMRFTIYQLRILFESIIVLTVMTEYREAIAKALKIIYRILKTRKITSITQLFVRQ
uniref:Uncharacterized protein n=1 Tax=Panagrolaimus sp. PS1159 TaxID=55785 RepID=A0AC35FZN1_9BILA